MWRIIQRKLIKGAQKAVVAGLVAASAAAVARYPVLADVLSEQNITSVTSVLFEVMLVSGSGVVGYFLTWLKRNNA